MPPQKMGRPKSDNPKDSLIRVRADKATIEKLDECATALDTSRSEVVRKGINHVYDGIKQK